MQAASCLYAPRFDDADLLFKALADPSRRTLLDVNCSHGVVGYSFLMALDEKEAARFKAEGRGFIAFLAEMVERSEPGARGSASPYKDRAVAPERSAQATAAVLAWRAAGGEDSGSP